VDESREVDECKPLAAGLARLDGGAGLPVSDPTSLRWVDVSVGRCMLTLSKSVLKAPTISALETIIW
jgi:hypothetical protein